MSTEMQRYENHHRLGLEPDPEGGWVRYGDHLKALAVARDEEARDAADRVEALPWLDNGRTVNRNLAIIAARRRLTR